LSGGHAALPLWALRFPFIRWRWSAAGWCDEAIELCLAALGFFRDSGQRGTPDPTGYKGFYYQLLDMQSGLRNGVRNCR
jgi:hypothetical protein